MVQIWKRTPQDGVTFYLERTTLPVAPKPVRKRKALKRGYGRKTVRR
jgi:hypothetical protein